MDPKPILRAFVQELTSKFPAICGAPMKLQSKAKFPISQLFESGQVYIVCHILFKKKLIRPKIKKNACLSYDSFCDNEQWELTLDLHSLVYFYSNIVD